ncbi:MAG: glycerophosphodiester phosphodiesterase [Clostridia bacterium]|nr:glycerophosphodiester phosphodiesterase [Clostridia bacterium]
MKKIVCILLSLVLVLLGGCAEEEKKPTESAPASSEVVSEPIDQPGTEIEEVEINASLSAQSTTILDVKSTEIFNQLNEEKTPSNAIFYLDDELFIVSDDGLYVPFDAAISMCADSVIPVLYVRTEKAAKTLSTRLKSGDVTDCIVMSDKPELVNSVREAIPTISGAIDARENLLDMDITYLIPLRNEANKNKAKIILFGSHATNEQIVYLQKRLMTIWVETADSSVEAHCNAFTSGANGIVSTNSKSVFGAIDIFEKDTLFREIFVVGHRGQPATNVDNSLSGARAAIDSGADMVECDVYMSADREFVVLHNNDISYYTGGIGKVEELRTEQIQYFILKGTKDEHIPKLQEFFDSFRNDDIMYSIEIKTSDADAIYWLRDLITASGVSHQVNLISFNLSQLILAREIIPEISCGYLGTVEGIYSDIVPYLNKYNLSYHPTNSKMSPGNAYELNNRGISVNPWTYSKEETLLNDLLSGYLSLTTDGALWASDIVAKIEADQQMSVNLSEEFKFSATAITKKAEKEIECEPIVIDGDVKFKKGENGYTASKKGDATVILRYASTLKSGKTVYHYSRSVKVTVE